MDPGLREWWSGERVPCPEHLRIRLDTAIDDLHYRETRFLLVMGFVIAIVSLIVDAIALSEHFAKIAAIRLVGTVPLQLAGLAMPRSKLRLQKFLMGFSLIYYGLSLFYASSLAPRPIDIVLAIGPIMLFGIVVPLLPFRRKGVLLFLAGVVVPLGLLALVLRGESLFTEVFLLILIIVTIGSGILARRVRWLERNSLMLTLLAEDRAVDLEESNARLRELSMQDPLTDLANRRWVEIAFERDYSQTPEEAPGHTALLLLDLDNFKSFNDRWGHDAGDTCLKAVAEVIRHSAGKHGGIAARFGGEEFVAVARFDKVSDAVALAEELRVGVERIEMDCGEPDDAVTCTTSIGIAVHEGLGKAKLADLLKRADDALYQAKRDGRNRHRLAA